MHPCVYRTRGPRRNGIGRGAELRHRRRKEIGRSIAFAGGGNDLLFVNLHLSKEEARLGAPRLGPGRPLRRRRRRCFAVDDVPRCRCLERYARRGPRLLLPAERVRREEVRDRGLIFAQLEYLRPAIEDMQTYLSGQPDASDAEEIREHISTLENQVRQH